MSDVEVTFTLTLTSGNDSLVAHPELEVGRLLHRTATRVEAGVWTGTLMDSNGNTVGSFTGLPDRPTE